MSDMKRRKRNFRSAPAVAPFISVKATAASGRCGYCGMADVLPAPATLEAPDRAGDPAGPEDPPPGEASQ